MPLDSLVSLVSDSPWTYAVILAIAALDAVLPLVPSETTVITAGVLAGTGDLNIGLVIAAGALGAYAGDTSAYGLGRRFGRRLEPIIFRGAKGRGRYEWAARTIERYGGPLILGARFVPGGRTAATVTAGLVGMRAKRFAGFAGAAGIAWASYAGLVGYLGGRAFEDDPLLGLALGFGIAAAVFVLVEVARRIRRRRRGQAGGEPVAGRSSPRPLLIRPRRAWSATCSPR